MDTIKKLNEMSDTLKLLDPYKKKLEDLDYTKGVPGLQKASVPQRGYIHGLCKKLDINENDLENEVRDMTIIEASDVIEELKYYADQLKHDEKQQFSSYYNRGRQYANFDDVDEVF